MADTSPYNVKAIAKHLASVEDMVIQMYIDDAVLEVADQKPPAKYEEKMQRYLAAHFATLDKRRPESQRVDGLQTNYKAGSPEDRGLNATEYGQEYQRLLKQSKGTSFKVF
jgi:hypothetical protein